MEPTETNAKEWSEAKRISSHHHLDAAGVKHCKIYGPLFFGSVHAFGENFDLSADSAEVIIDFRESRVADTSAIDAPHKMTERHHRAGKNPAPPQPRQLTAAPQRRGAC